MSSTSKNTRSSSISTTEYISGTEDAYKLDQEKIKVEVSFHALSDKSIGVLVDLRFDEHGNKMAASRLEWFPKSQCVLSRVETPGLMSKYFLYAPKWLLDNKNVKYNP